METILNSGRHHHVAIVSILLITLALIAGMVGCAPRSQNLEIRTWYDLDAVRYNLRGHHRLMNDLDATTPGYEELASPTANQGKGWEPIGIFVSTQGFKGLTGTFDGQGYEIRDLFINHPGQNWGSVGLFGAVGEGGVVEDIGVMNVTVIGDYQVGGLVGCNEGTVRDCYSSGSVTGESYVGYVGGLVGDNSGTVSNSYSSGNVTGDVKVGGLVGWNYGTVSNSYSTGSVTGNSSVGGLVGWNYGTVSNSYSTGSVTGNSSVGGLVGENKGTVSNSFWDTETSGQATSDGGVGKTTVEMQDIATFSGVAWNIIAVGGSGERNPVYIWNIVDDQTYPFLSWQPV